jgi:hypothetical protein
MNALRLLSIALVFSVSLSNIAQSQEKKTEVVKPLAGEWIDLIGGGQFEKLWKSTEFGGEGKVDCTNDVLTLKTGVPLTGVNLREQVLPNENYAVRWKAQRTQGSDFFSCLTFPVGDAFCSVVVGGWGGGVVGISSINGNDASENQTTQYLSFDNNRWYAFELTVTSSNITFNVDGKSLIDVEREGNRFDTRIEVHRSRPLGICAYQCVAQVMDFEYRVIPVETSKSTSANSSDDKPIFVRNSTSDDGTLKAMETAIAKYHVVNGPFEKAQIDLVGAVHVGQMEYYTELNKRFKDYDAVLFELVADPDIRIAGRRDSEGVINPVSSLQVAMKDALELDFQLDGIDYEAKNFVHADMTPDEFMEDMSKRKDSFVKMFARLMGSSIAMQSSQGNQDAAILAALMNPDRTRALRRVFAQQLQSSEMQMAGIADANGQSTLVTERNGKAMKVLEEQLKKGKTKIAIFYGAAHLDDMHLRLLKDFNAKLEGIEWLEAWDLR